MFTLIDRGFTFAIAHPRGDGDLGHDWYEQGKYEQKLNTFLDTRTCIQFLIDSGYTRVGSIALKARSAGGLIAGNAIFWTSDVEHIPLVSAIVAQVPFTDPITDLIDKFVPWTAYEW